MIFQEISIICRSFMEDVLQQSLAELLNSGTFSQLASSVAEERNKRNALQKMVKRWEAIILLLRIIVV